MRRRPVIGVTSYARDDATPPRFSLPCGYIDSVREAGGVPLLLPPGERETDGLLDVLDGLILAGGGDISPAAYGGNPHETIYSVCAERDEFEFSLARAALTRPDLALLCICRGMQVLNVVSGGTLHEHLPEEFGETVMHRLPPRVTSRHPVRVEPSSRLAGILDATETEVLSWHHQGVDRIGETLRPVAWAADGVIEAVEHLTHPWCIGVQWHPEMQPGETAQDHLFKALVQAARKRV
ncbi:MAG: gamma-glutamyl-gamma-aminobutyrate hydrolase family protein [Deltaproteobacteria bacterium]|nr:gamma-glutamyl-gamma-aminobutyrate hydrolase family protein [Deltaproteobacteria bacterium]